MRTLSPLSWSASQRHRINEKRLAIMGLIVGVLFGLVSCAGRPADQADNPTVISYAGAASRLRGLEPAEVEEQLRDWARTGLASHLELDTAQLRDATYDTVPVRDLAFADLSRQSTGPGRALVDGHGVLHVLVPRDDPHEARTIGLLIDQYRSDAGADPQQVQIHHYQIHPETQTIELTPEKPAPTADVRSAHGFVTMRVDDRKGLTDFLAQTRHLSWLEVRGSEVWAGGWNWPDVPAVPLDVEDVSVIQRGYLQPSTDPRPGFSLDPGPPETRDDILAILPGLRPDLAGRVISHDWTGSSFQSADGLAKVVDSALFRNNTQPTALAEAGLPSDRSQLWALHLLLAGRPAYSQARYDGRLEGTKVGMTLFYNDHTAKDWVSGVGTGVPTTAVGGFISDPEAVTPWSHCPAGPEPEYGRLWFGQNESSFTFAGDRVSIGAQATRLFARSDSNGGTEVEPSFSFGRGMRWWDQHYQAVADYEPQYQRLDQIMRWSGALEWLVAKTPARLPQLDDSAIRLDLRFQDWYAQHNELRERSQIEFVTPPSATQEAIRAKPSTVFKECGLLGITGGVSLGDILRREGDQSFHADLPEPLRRGGLFDKASHFDSASGSGQIKQVSIDSHGQVTDSVQRTFSTTADGRAVIDLEASGRRVSPFGNLKVWRTETATRQLTVEMAAGQGQIVENIAFQGQELGQLALRKDPVARRDVDTVTVQWRSGPLDRVRRVLESIQDHLVSQPVAGVPAARDGVLVSYQDGSGQIRYKIGGPDVPWLSIDNESRPPGDDLVFRFGGPNPQTGKPEFFFARPSPAPTLPPEGGWIDVTPATGDHSAQLRLAGPPSNDARTVRVSTPDGRSSTLWQMGDHLRVPMTDPIQGFNGTAEGAALLRDFPRVADAMRGAAHTTDGLLRGVRLGEDGVALVNADTVILVAADHQWAQRVLQASSLDPLHVSLIRIEGGHALLVDPGELTVLPGSAQRMNLSEVWNTGSDNIYLHRSMLVFERGSLIPNPLPPDTHVIVRTAVVAAPVSTVVAALPDVRLHGGAEWWGMSGIGTNPTSTTSTTTTTPARPGSSAVPAPSGQILLVCPDTNEHIPGCAE